jgi:hypothetical protein
MNNAVILPRQARDKHRESTQKERCVFLQFSMAARRSWPVRTNENETAGVFLSFSSQFSDRERRFAKTGSGQAQVQVTKTAPFFVGKQA